jgi:hypothetical protein
MPLTPVRRDDQQGPTIIKSLDPPVGHLEPRLAPIAPEHALGLA